MLAATGDHRNESQPSTSSNIESSQLCRHFEFPDILLATDNFNESLVIGRGGFGKVYKGSITNGSTVSVAAIKRLDPMSGQGASEFWAEVEMLSKFRHCHLVSLFGYCKYEKEMILVYEYMPNGTLEDHLHKLGTPLSWLQRLKICIGAARGLDYLHTGTGTSVGVIHRDVKSSNILLDESWAARISDFGLSKTGPTNQTLTYVNTLVKGTFGYLDPDYTWTGMLTRKSDVYAFGVVLLEALCRKRAGERNPGEEAINLARWAQESIKKGNLKQIIDSNIHSEISPKCLKEFARIAEKCLLNSPKQRPTMAEVVVGLSSVLTLQEKINTSLQAAGKTIFGKMIDMLPSSTNTEKSAHVDSKLSSNSKVKSRNADDKIEDGNKYSINPVPNLKMFTFADLAKATIYFSQALSPDVYEEVFIGWVDKNTFAPSTQGTGIMVAVERFYGRNDLNCQRVASVLGQMAHPNVIRLLGYCNQRESESLLVYEHMHMENLGHFLFGDVAKPLSWKTRLIIMIGVARGLAYIHFSQNHLIDCDVKTFNILLDEVILSHLRSLVDFNAKLGLFGKEKSIHGMRDTFSLIHFGNRRPYLEPDYVQTGQMTMKSDIYSFGVVLLETLTGQRAINMNRRDGEYCNLVRWASPFLEERSELKKIMDPRLEENYSLKGAFKCSALALRCLALDRKNRPSSEEVLRSLEEIYAVNR